VHLIYHLEHTEPRIASNDVERAVKRTRTGSALHLLSAQ